MPKFSRSGAAAGLTAVDLFAGCGGLSEGFMASGNYEALGHVEWEVPMVKTLRNRLTKKWKHSEDESKKNSIDDDDFSNSF